MRHAKNNPNSANVGGINPLMQSFPRKNVELKEKFGMKLFR